MKRPITPAMAKKLRKLAQFLDKENICIGANAMRLSIYDGKGRYRDDVKIQKIFNTPGETMLTFWVDQVEKCHHRKFVVDEKSVAEDKDESYESDEAW